MWGAIHAAELWDGTQECETPEYASAVVKMLIEQPSLIEGMCNNIIAQKKIGTYDLSISPYEECCTIFTPKAPKTAPHLDEVMAFEKKFDYESLIKEALANIEVMILSDNEEEKNDLL